MRDGRFWLLLLAVLALWVALLHPTWKRRAAAYSLIAVVDITRSMNVEDLVLEKQAVSRLEFVKARLKQLAKVLPCGSRLGLGVFTERRSALLLEPVEVCRHLYELETVIKDLDWRSAWAADSRIGEGLLDAMRLMRRAELQGHWLLFFTDGHEAPPVNSRYVPDFTQVRGQVTGMLVGVGASKLSPIPKFDEAGQKIGFYAPEDVPHRSTFGLPLEDAARLPGYDPRNAPFGGEWLLGQEHLSSRKDDHLRSLARQSGLEYRVLSDPHALLAAISASGARQFVWTQVALWPTLATLALLALSIGYLLDVIGRRRW